MIKIRDEFEFNNWFKINYKKLGFSKIIKDNGGRFPDFIMEKDGKKVRIELETYSSNFILHKHPINKTDFVVCIEKDIDLPVQTIIAKNFKLVGFEQKRPYSLQEQILKLFKNKKVVTSSEIAKLLKISWNTADSYLKELLIEGKIERIKKEGVNLWIIK